jgi:hypothetical protein
MTRLPGAGPLLVILGVFLHYVSDAQKFFTLQVRDALIWMACSAEHGTLITSVKS